MFNMFIKLMFFVFLLSLVSGLYVDDPCTLNHDGEPGVCKKDCQLALDMLRCDRIKPTICSFIKSDPVLCCPEDEIYSVCSTPGNYPIKIAVPGQSQRTMLATITEIPQPDDNYTTHFRIKESVNFPAPYYKRISVKKCNEYNYKNLYRHLLIRKTNLDGTFTYHRRHYFVRGRKARIEDYLHMAAIGWTFANESGYSWNCGGSLISENYVLTAAHCSYIRGDYFLSQEPTVVRLGHVDLTENEKDKFQEIKIEKIILHPNYTGQSTYHDIALLKLNEEANIDSGSNIKPICLWQTENIPDERPTAAGWGKLGYYEDSSKDLQYGQLDIINEDICKSFYNTSRKLSKGILQEQLCAGDFKEGKDTCQGDSGGPLQIRDAEHPKIQYLIGITSFGIRCGVLNSPSVYTKVSSYVEWIESVVWPN